MGCAVLAFIMRPDILPAGSIFAERNTHTFGIVYDIIFNDPALTPMRSDKSELLGCGRRPLRSRLTHNKSADGDIINSGRTRIEAAVPYIDLHRLFVGVMVMEIGVNIGIFIIRFTVPCVS